MTRHNLMQHPLGRSLAVLAATTLLLVVMQVGAPSETSGAASREPYAPFRMTYMGGVSSEGPVTLDLTWRSGSSWEIVIVASPERKDSVGSSMTYERGILTTFDSVFGTTTSEPSCPGDRGATVIPELWLDARAYTAENGWEALGRDANGYDQFQRVTGIGEGQYKEIFRRDPATGLVMEVGRLDGSTYVPTIRVLSYSPLVSSQPGPYRCPDPAPTPTPWATEIADPP